VDGRARRQSLQEQIHDVLELDAAMRLPSGAYKIAHEAVGSWAPSSRNEQLGLSGRAPTPAGKKRQRRWRDADGDFRHELKPVEHIEERPGHGQEVVETQFTQPTFRQAAPEELQVSTYVG